MVIETLFWVSLFLFFHTWVGYPLMLMLITSGKARSPEFPVEQEVPFVSVVIAAYNAAGKIEGKLKNTLALDYPGDKLEVIVVSDGSTDDTGLKAKSLNESNVFIHELERNQGKSSAQNYGVQRARGEIIVFTDVDAQLDRGFLLNIVSYFSDSSVACAGGRAIYMRQEGSISASQALYWRLEQFIKKAESDLGVLISLSGWGFAVRKRDFVPLDPDTGDDMILPLEMSLRGKRSVFAPNAVVRDTMPSTFKGELKARQRITLRNLIGLMRRKSLLIPWRFPKLSFAIWSHELLRWLSPLLMLTVLACSLWLYFSTGSRLYGFVVYVQCIGYFCGVIGIVVNVFKFRLPVIGYFSSFLIANLGFLVGFLKYVAGKRMQSYRNIN